MMIQEVIEKCLDTMMSLSIFLKQLLIRSGIVAWSGMSLFAAIVWRSVVGLSGWLGSSGIFLWTAALSCWRGLGFAMAKAYVAYVLFIVGLIGGSAYWYAGKLTSMHHRVSPIVVDEDAQQVIDEMRERFEQRLTATEQHVRKLEQELSKKKIELEQIVAERDAVIEKNVIVASDQIKQRMNKVGKAEKELEVRFLATEKYIKELEKKVHELERQDVQEAKRLAVINHVIRQEVADQMGAIKESMQEREQKKKRKNLINRFLDQLVDEGDE
jgi:exonuclease VII small subunit